MQVSELILNLKKAIVVATYKLIEARKYGFHDSINTLERDILIYTNKVFILENISTCDNEKDFYCDFSKIKEEYMGFCKEISEDEIKNIANEIFAKKLQEQVLSKLPCIDNICEDIDIISEQLSTNAFVITMASPVYAETSNVASVGLSFNVVFTPTDTTRTWVITPTFTNLQWTNFTPASGVTLGISGDRAAQYRLTWDGRVEFKGYMSLNAATNPNANGSTVTITGATLPSQLRPSGSNLSLDTFIHALKTNDGYLMYGGNLVVTTAGNLTITYRDDDYTGASHTENDSFINLNGVSYLSGQ